MSVIASLAIAGSALGSAADVASFDWPHARGPRFDGRFPHATPLSPWPAEGPALQWEQPLGQGFSGMVVAAGRVFTQHQKSSGQELVCFDLATGAEVWRTRYAFPWEMDGRYPGPYGTPTIADGRVYFSDCYGVIGCANAKDGAILWRFDAVKQLNPAGVDFGYAAAPLVLAGRVYAPAPAADGKVSGFCLDAATGVLVWQTGTSVPSYASFSPIALGGKPCLLLPLRNGVAIYDQASGAELWKEEWTRGYDEHSCWSIFQEPYLFFPSAFRRGARVYRLGWQDGRVQGDMVWEDRVMSNDVLSSVLHDGHLYGFDVQSQQSELMGRTRGTLKCVELATGTVRWTQTGIKHCSATLIGARLLLLEDEGDLVLVDPSPAEYRELARAALPQKGKLWAAPVIIGDRLFIRGSQSIACYSLTAGSAKAAQAPGSSRAAIEPQTAPTLAENIRSWFEHYRSDVFVAPSSRVLLKWYASALGLLALALALSRVRLARIFHALLASDPPRCARIKSTDSTVLAIRAKCKTPSGFAFSPHEPETCAGEMKSSGWDMGRNQFEKCGLAATLRAEWIGPAALLGLLGTFALTIATGRFSLTAPLTLFALFCAVVPACRDPGAADAAQNRGLGSILRLAAFIALCYGYFRLCAWLFLVSGWGFLVGFPAVVVLAIGWQRARLSARLRREVAAVLWPLLAFSAYFWSSAVAVVWSAKG